MSRKPAKTQRRRTTKPKRNNAPTVAPLGSLALAELQGQVSALTRELAEAREQQTATSEVLRVISSSLGELGPVFEAILSNATQICGAEFGVLHMAEGDAFRTVALHNAPLEYAESKRRDPTVRYLPKDSALARVRATLAPVQIADVLAEAAYTEPALTKTPPGWSLPGLPESGAWWRCRWSRTEFSSAPSSFTERKCGHSPTSRSRW